MSRIEETFALAKKEKRAALITYIMGCDPDYSTSLRILKGLPAAGADIIELGMPFSDPMADGPVIQEASYRALKAGGSTKKVLAMAQEFRRKNQKTPLVLMGYYNPIYQFGVKKFVNAAMEAGIDGIIIVDLPPEEEREFVKISGPAGFAFIRLTSPTTSPERAKTVLKNASGFVYYISITGVTGTKSASSSQVKKSIKEMRRATHLPIAVGFGIKTPVQAAEIAAFAEGVVVGSALIKQIHLHRGSKKRMVKAIFDFTRALKRSVKKPNVAKISA